MAYTNPSVSDFKAFFTRDFPYNTDPNLGVMDADVTKAFTFTNMGINPGLFGDQGSYTNAYLLLSAHYLVMNLRASSQGLSGQYSWLEASKGVGSVNQAFSVPQRILDNPLLSMLTKTNYGAMYLQLILPGLIGQTFSVQGTTRP